MSSIDDRGPIYESFASCCTAYELEGGPWRRFRAPAFICKPPHDPADTLEALAQKFSKEEICQAGLATLDQDNKLVVNPVLRDSSSPILILRSKRDKPPFDLVTSAGCISGRTLPLFAVLRDGHFRAQLANVSNNLCIAFSTREAAALLSVGIPATVATGLETIGRRRLGKLRRCFALDDADAEEQKPLTLAAGFQKANDLPQDPAGAGMKIVFLEWSVLSFSQAEPEGLAQVRSHFRRVRTYLGVDTDRIRAWRPSVETLDGLKFCLDHGTRSDCRDILMENMAADVAPLVEFTQGNPDKPERAVQANVPVSFLTAWHELCDASARNNKEDMSAALMAFDKALRAEFIEPVLKEAMAEADPMRRNLLAGAANLSRLLQLRLVSGPAGLALGIGGAGKAGSTSRAEEIKQILALSERFLDVAKEIMPCKKPRVGVKKPHRLR